MGITNRPITLSVSQPGSCPLLKQGDRWIISGLEIEKPGNVKLCGAGLCSVYPKLDALLKSLPSSGVLPDDYLLCDAEGCDAAFRMEYTASPAPTQGVPAQGSTRRLERGAMAATTMLKKSGPFLSRLPKELAADLVGICTSARYEDGQIILMQGVYGEHLYIVAEGLADVARIKGESDITVLVTLGKGECFGEMSILTGELTAAEVRSRGISTVLSVHKEKLESLLLKSPVLSREFSKLLADRLKASNVSLESELNRGILGKLSMISLVDLVQTLHQSRRTGTLVLNYAGEQARIGFRNGVLSFAVVGDTMGDEAFYKVVAWPDGDFCFEQTEPNAGDPGKVERDTMGLMMEGMRRLDEKASSS